MFLGQWIGNEGGHGAGNIVHLHLELRLNSKSVSWDGRVIDGWAAHEDCDGYNQAANTSQNQAPCTENSDGTPIDYQGYISRSSTQAVPMTSQGGYPQFMLPTVPLLNTNSSFEIDADGDRTPDGWSREHLGMGDTLVNDPKIGGRGFKITGAAGVNKALSQRISVSQRDGVAGQKYTIRGWSKSSGTSATGGTYGISIRFQNTDGTSSRFVAPFTKSSHGWQEVVSSFTVPKNFSALDASLLYENQKGSATFDDMKVTTP